MTPGEKEWPEFDIGWSEEIRMWTFAGKGETKTERYLPISQVAERLLSDEAVEAAGRAVFRADRDAAGQPKNADIPLTDMERDSLRPALAALAAAFLQEEE